MSTATFNLLLIITPLLIGGVIALINTDGINQTTEKAESWIRKKQKEFSASNGWFFKYVAHPVFWLVVKFSDWTDAFAHRGLKNGLRVAITFYLVIGWLVLLYSIFMVIVILVISALVIYVVFKLLVNSDDDVKKGYEAGKGFKLFGSSLEKCRACGARVSSDASVCPNCGEDLKNFKLFGGSTQKCRACGAEVSTDASYCPSCGEDLKSFKLFGGSTQKCRACGAEVSTDASYCPSCGEDLKNFKLFGGSTQKCRACGAEASTDAKVCPACGEDLTSFKLF